MKTLVVYDSVHGNTEIIARAIGSAFGNEARVVRASDAGPADLQGIDLLVVGSPTQGGRPTKAVQDFLAGLPPDAVKGRKAAAFDTRLPSKLVVIFGYAAGKLGDYLKKHGAALSAAPEAFFVAGSNGPLKDGEAERAAAWAKKLAV